ncbi:hypothetical protein D3C75_873100 [compost metagenome]
MRLPGFDIIAVLLDMADRRTEYGAACRPHRQQCNLAFECDEPFDNNAGSFGTRAFKRRIPGGFRILRLSADALPFARRAHNRLNNTRCAQLIKRSAQLFQTVGKAVRRSR